MKNGVRAGDSAQTLFFFAIFTTPFMKGGTCYMSCVKRYIVDEIIDLFYRDFTPMEIAKKLHISEDDVACILNELED